MPPTTTLTALEVQAPRQTHGHDLARHLGEPLMGGNRIDLLDGRTHARDALFAAIASAKDHINVACTLSGTDRPGEDFVQRLIARCRAGVQVNMLIYGHDPSSTPVVQRLRAAGVALCTAAPRVNWWTWLTPNHSRHDHRGLMVADGRVGFLGGVHRDDAALPDPSAEQAGTCPDLRGATPDTCGRDLFVRLEGPVVQRLQRLFISRWQRHSTSSLPVARYHPPLPPVGAQRAAIVASETGRHPVASDAALLAAIASASQRVWMDTGSTGPTHRVALALAEAARRGVQVRLLLPGQGGERGPLRAGCRHDALLLRAGVHLHVRQDRPLRDRFCVIDGLWCSVASPNAVTQLVALDERFGAQLERAFLDGQACAQEVDAATLSRRPVWFALRGKLFRGAAFFP